MTEELFQRRKGETHGRYFRMTNQYYQCSSLVRRTCVPVCLCVKRKDGGARTPDAQCPVCGPLYVLMSHSHGGDVLHSNGGVDRASVSHTRRCVPPHGTQLNQKGGSMFEIPITNVTYQSEVFCYFSTS